MINFTNFTDMFFWDFKRMDNVNYNFKVVENLCKVKKEDHLDIFNKPIIIILVSIIECILYDFLRRINQHTNEIIPGLDHKKINDTKNKIIDELSPIIAHIKKHNYLQEIKGEVLYDNLDELRKLRNRVHIQNRNNQLDRNEDKIWTNYSVQLAGNTLERICIVLCNSYSRPGKSPISFRNFPKPWQ